MIKTAVIILLLVFFALIAKICQKSWLAPGAFFAAAWATYLFVPFAIAPEYQIWWRGALWILLSAVSVYIGSVIGFRYLRYSPDKKIFRRKIILPAAKTVIFFASILGTIAFAITLHSRGYGLADFLSVDSLSKMGNDFSVARYFLNYDIPAIARFLNSFIYLASFAGGAFFAASKRIGGKIFSFLPFIPAALFGVALTTRTSIFFPVICWISSYLAASVFLNRGRFTVSLKKILTMGLIAAIFIFAAVSLSMLRSQRTSFEQVQEVWDHTKIGAFGSPAAFSVWVENERYGDTNLKMGALTFAGIFDFFNIEKRLQGLYQEKIELANDGEVTNVYTIFRGLIGDFNFAGALILSFIFGFIGGLFFRLAVLGKPIGIPFLAGFYSITIWSYFVNLFIYNSILFGWFLFLFYVILLVKPARNESVSP
ncbi:MAG TPA: O-antigen polymerase [Candidatus Pacearchaeota archaeon]|nr:O-antigen polymerase [Candidatus Pacearchaeota archaeon]